MNVYAVNNDGSDDRGADDGHEKLRVPTWEEIAVLDAELQRRARKSSLRLLRTDKVLDGAGR